MTKLQKWFGVTESGAKALKVLKYGMKMKIFG